MVDIRRFQGPADPRYLVLNNEEVARFIQIISPHKIGKDQLWFLDTVDFTASILMGYMNALVDEWDANLRGDLADDTTGAELVGYTPPSTGTVGTVRSFLDSLWSSIGASFIRWTAGALGASIRTVLDKLRETVTPEDFGAIGDATDRPVSQWLIGGAIDRGYADLAAIQVDYPHVTALTDSIDWAGFQAAINHCETVGKPLRCSGDYRMNRGLLIDSPINLDGGGKFAVGANTTPSYVAGARIQATAAVPIMLHCIAPGSPTAIWGLRINGLLLDANNLADKCLEASSCIRSQFTDLEGRRCIVVGFDFNDASGQYFFKNWINAVHYNSTASSAAQNSAGVWFRDTAAMGGGMVQCLVGWITTFTRDGDGIVIGGSDNNEYGSLIGNTSTGTGRSLVFKGPNGFGNLQPRNNFIRYTGGSVVDETNSRTNTILNMASESSSITLTGSGGETKFRAFNYVTGQWWSTPDYTMKDIQVYPVGALETHGSARGAMNALWGTIDLADGATQGVSLSSIMPYAWHSGNLKAITLHFAADTAFAGNFRVKVRAMTPSMGAATATPTTNEDFTITPDTNANRPTKATLTFAAPQSVTKGDVILIRIDRIGADGADTHTGAMRLLSVGLHYTSNGPSSDGGGGGPWQVLDPTI